MVCELLGPFPIISFELYGLTFKVKFKNKFDFIKSVSPKKFKSVVFTDCLSAPGIPCVAHLPCKQLYMRRLGLKKSWFPDNSPFLAF